MLDVKRTERLLRREASGIAEERKGLGTSEEVQPVLGRSNDRSPGDMLGRCR